jgi:hypothetical protein
LLLLQQPLLGASSLTAPRLAPEALEEHSLLVELQPDSLTAPRLAPEALEEHSLLVELQPDSPTAPRLAPEALEEHSLLVALQPESPTAPRLAPLALLPEAGQAPQSSPDFIAPGLADSLVQDAGQVSVESLTAPALTALGGLPVEQAERVSRQQPAMSVSRFRMDESSEGAGGCEPGLGTKLG